MEHQNGLRIEYFPSTEMILISPDNSLSHSSTKRLVGIAVSRIQSEQTQAPARCDVDPIFYASRLRVGLFRLDLRGPLRRAGCKRGKARLQSAPLRTSDVSVGLGRAAEQDPPMRFRTRSAL